MSVNAEKFKCFVRYMIQVAKQKRCVPYYELENAFGLNHNQVGTYSGNLGDYCLKKEIPLLNSLIISATECKPSHGFDWYEKQYGKSWGEMVSECWKHFHVTSTRERSKSKILAVWIKKLRAFLVGDKFSLQK